MSPFAFSMIQPFDEVFADFNRLNQRRIENDEVWALWDVIWLRNEGDMRIGSFWRKGAPQLVIFMTAAFEMWLFIEDGVM